MNNQRSYAKFVYSVIATRCKRSKVIIQRATRTDGTGDKNERQGSKNFIGRSSNRMFSELTYTHTTAAYFLAEEKQNKFPKKLTENKEHHSCCLHLAWVSSGEGELSTYCWTANISRTIQCFWD